MATTKELEAAQMRITQPRYTPPRNKAEEEAELALEQLKQEQFGDDRGYYDGVGVFRVGAEPYYDSDGILHYASSPTEQDKKDLQKILKQMERESKRR